MRTEILYEDNSILVIRKPAGLAVQSARIGQADVVSELKSYLAKQAGAGDAIVIPVWNGPGTVKLVLVDGNGKPANDKLVQDVYNYIVSPNNRSARLLPTGTAELTCAAATTIAVNYVITGLVYDETTGIEQIKADFAEAIRAVYAKAKIEGVLRYNDVRPLISSIAGVEDFDSFTMNGKTQNITLKSEEYPDTGTLNFS